MNDCLEKMDEICPLCKVSNIKRKAIDYVNYTVCESEFSCDSCGVIGYWAYGSYDPAYPYPVKPKYTVFQKIKQFIYNYFNKDLDLL